MKHRLFSLLLAAALLLGLAAPAFADDMADPQASAAEELYQLGLFQGTGTDAAGNPVFSLDRAPTRNEAVTMLVRLLGAEELALTLSPDCPFTDVNGWAAPYVGYAFQTGLTAGTSATTYSGSRPVTAAQYLTFLLRALGYEDGVDFQWNTAWELTDKLGITRGEYGADTPFTRGDAALVSYHALSVPLKGQDLTLYEQIFGPSRELRPYAAHEDVPDYGVWLSDAAELCVSGTDGSWYGYIESVLGTGDYADALHEFGYFLSGGGELLTPEDLAALAEMTSETFSALPEETVLRLEDLIHDRPVTLTAENGSGTVIRLSKELYAGRLAVVLAVNTDISEEMRDAVKDQIDELPGGTLPDDVAVAYASYYLLPVLYEQVCVLLPVLSAVEAAGPEELPALARRCYAAAERLDLALDRAFDLLSDYDELWDFLTPLETLYSENLWLLTETPDAENCVAYLAQAIQCTAKIAPALEELNELLSGLLNEQIG